MIEDIANALMAEIEHLHGLTTLTPISPDHCRGVPSFKPEQVYAMLRVEVALKHEETIWNEARDTVELSRQVVDEAQGKHEGPLTLLGVAVYYVRKLPEPGWRVVNPMKAKKGS